MSRYTVILALAVCLMSLGCQALDKDPILGSKPSAPQPQFGSSFSTYSDR